MKMIDVLRMSSATQPRLALDDDDDNCDDDDDDDDDGIDADLSRR